MQLILKDGVLSLERNVPLPLMADIGTATRMNDWEVLNCFFAGRSRGKHVARRHLIASLTTYTECDIKNFMDNNRS